MDQEQQAQEPCAKRARVDSQLSPGSAGGKQGPAGAGQSFVTGTTGTTATSAKPFPTAQNAAATKPAAATGAQTAGTLLEAVTSQNSSAAPAPPVAAPVAGTAPAKGAAKPPASAFLVSAHEAVRFRAVAGGDADALAAEIDAGGKPFSVEFMHQQFGDEEQIRGYRDLRVDVWVHVLSYTTWIDIAYASKRPGADKLTAIFEGAFPCGYCRSREEFVSSCLSACAELPDLLGPGVGDTVAALRLPWPAGGHFGLAPPAAAAALAAPAAAADPAGDAMQVDAASAASAAASTAGATGAAGGGLEVVIKRWQVCSAPPAIKALHQRMEPLLLFTIDGANFVDDEDPQWELLLPVARGAGGRAAVLGLATLFNFWAYPDSCRSRVSQVLVLGPWQGGGLGKALLQVSYRMARDRGCVDLTVEDPTPNLQRVREKLEVETLRGLDWVAAQAGKCLDAVARGSPAWPHTELPPAVQQQLQQRAQPRQPAHPPPQPQQPAQGDAAAAPEAAGEPGAAAAQMSAADDAAAEASSAGAAAASAGPPSAFFAALHLQSAAEHCVPAAVVVEAREGEARRREAVRTKLEQRERRRRERLGAPGAAQGAPAQQQQPAAAAGPGAAAAPKPAPLCTALVPPAAFVGAITQLTKIHRSQVLVAWEALLWTLAAARQPPSPRIRQALLALVERRLEATHFSSVGRAASAKRLVDLPVPNKKKKPPPAEGAEGAGDAGAGGSGSAVPEPEPVAQAEAEQGEEGEEEGEEDAGAPEMKDAPPFFMYRLYGTAAQAPCTGDEEAMTTGRLNLTQVTGEDKATRMADLLRERREQLEALAALLLGGKAPAAAGSKAPAGGSKPLTAAGAQRPAGAGGSGAGAGALGAAAGFGAPGGLGGATAGGKDGKPALPAALAALEGRLGGRI